VSTVFPNVLGNIGKHCRHPWASVKNRTSAVKGFLWFFLRFSLNIGNGMGYRESVASTLNIQRQNYAHVCTKTF
jgi:hypothetical protein